MPTISDIGGGNNDFPDLISWGSARSSSSDLEIAHVYADQYLTSDFDHRSDFLGGYEVIGMGNDFVGDYSDAGVITITRDPSYTGWLIDDRTGRGHWKNLIIDCVDNNIVFGGGIKTFRATSVGFKGRNAPSFDEVSSSFYGIFNKCAFFTESQDAANFRYGQVEINDSIAVGNFNSLYGTVRIRDMSGVVTNVIFHEDSGSLCVGADGSTVTGSGCVTTDSSAVSLSIGSQDSALASYFEDISTGDLRINSVGQAALPSSLSWAYAGSSAPVHEFVGAVSVTASASAQLSKQVTLTSELQVNAVTQSALSKVVALSGESNVNASTLSFFEKSVTFIGTVQVNAASQSSVSKQVTLNGEASVIATSTGTLFNENVEIYTFAGGATVSASTSGQIVKVGLFTGEVQITTTAKGNAQKIAHLSGNAQVTSSTQSTFSKFAALTGNALAQVKTAAATAKRVLLAGAASVIAKANGTFFNTDTNVEAYEMTVEGRVKAPLVVQGTIKSITIQGRVK